MLEETRQDVVTADQKLASRIDTAVKMVVADRVLEFTELREQVKQGLVDMTALRKLAIKDVDYTQELRNETRQTVHIKDNPIRDDIGLSIDRAVSGVDRLLGEKLCPESQRLQEYLLRFADTILQARLEEQNGRNALVIASVVTKMEQVMRIAAGRMSRQQTTSNYNRRRVRLPSEEMKENVRSEQ